MCYHIFLAAGPEELARHFGRKADLIRNLRPPLRACAFSHLPYPCLLYTSFACHQEVERRQHVFVVGELHQVFVDDLGARFGGYVRTQIDRQVAVGIDVGALPRHAVAVGETRTAARQ